MIDYQELYRQARREIARNLPLEKAEVVLAKLDKMEQGQ